MQFSGVPAGHIFALQGGYYYRGEDGEPLRLVRLLSVTRNRWLCRLEGAAGISVSPETVVECVRRAADKELVEWEAVGIPPEIEHRRDAAEKAAARAAANPALDTLSAEERAKLYSRGSGN